MSPFHFTVYSNDAIVSKTGSGNRPREFKWNLNVPITKNYNKMAVESVFIRNVKANIIVADVGSIRDYNINAEGELQYDPTEFEIFKTQNITGSGTGATFLIYNDYEDYNVGLMLRDKGVGYTEGDTMYVLNSNGTLNAPGARTTITVGNVFNLNSITHDVIYPPTTDDASQTNMVRMIGAGNVDERELYSIRCRYVTNSYDTRNKHVNGGKIIYQGAMNFQNTNPGLSFCYDVNSLDFLNGEFELVLDSNYFGETGISEDLIFAVTFILME
jgi:hypothetical protein